VFVYIYICYGQVTATGVLLSVGHHVKCLPVALQSVEAVEEIFRRYLKTFLFRCPDS